MTTLCVFIGDMHSGSRCALSPSPENRQQKWLLQRWKETKSRVSARARGKKVLLMLGGDIVDSPGRDNRRMAVELLRGLASMADEMYAVPGTEWHAGEDGEEDRSVYDDLGVPEKHQKQFHALRIGSRVLWWAHHAIRVGNLPWTVSDGIYRGAKEAYHRAQMYSLDKPALVVGHHVHVAPPYPAVYLSTWAAIVGCWQLQTPYGSKRNPLSVPTIGCLLWTPEEDRLEPVCYAPPQDMVSR